MYAENAIDVARREMAWEVDYVREAKNAMHFRCEQFNVMQVYVLICEHMVKKLRRS